MRRPSLSTSLRCTAVLLPALLLAACSSNKPVARSAPPPPLPVIEIKPDARDALGSYRFTMSDGEQKMTADQFEAWMKANGIRVATGNAAPAEPVTVAGKDEKKKKK